jgi:hypothetical protein
MCNFRLGAIAKLLHFLRTVDTSKGHAAAMNFKPGLIHMPRIACPIAVPYPDFFSPRRNLVPSECPVEVLARIREAQQRARQKWRGV